MSTLVPCDVKWVHVDVDCYCTVDPRKAQRRRLHQHFWKEPYLNLIWKLTLLVLSRSHFPCKCSRGSSRKTSRPIRSWNQNALPPISRYFNKSTDAPWTRGAYQNLRRRTRPILRFTPTVWVWWVPAGIQLSIPRWLRGSREAKSGDHLSFVVVQDQISRKFLYYVRKSRMCIDQSYLWLLWRM